jgi:hypothetical protein
LDQNEDEDDEKNFKKTFLSIMLAHWGSGSYNWTKFYKTFETLVVRTKSGHCIHNTSFSSVTYDWAQ